MLHNKLNENVARIVILYVTLDMQHTFKYISCCQKKGEKYDADVY